MKREVSRLLDKSLDSMMLSVEHFNRPWDRGREEAVLILLDRSFELILKAVIVHKGGSIREPRAKETIGFDKCVRKCLSDSNVQCLNENEALTIQNINSLRDVAQHYFLDISEQELYMFSQAGLTLYGEILRKVFGIKLKDRLPERVLPISTEIPRDIVTLYDAEFSEITELIKPGNRKHLEARARLRPISILESSLKGERSQPSKADLNRTIHQLQEGKNWKDLFPGVAGLKLSTEGSGLQASIRITKSEGESIQLTGESTDGDKIVAVKKVNELGFYSLGANEVAKKVGLTMPKTLAFIHKLNLQDDPDMFKLIRIGKTKHKRYSIKAVDAIVESKEKLDVDQVWSEYQQR